MTDVASRPGASAHRLVRLAAGAAIALAALSSCGPADTRPNLLIVLMDTLRPDRLGCYGYGRDTSPTVDSLAARGTVYGRCISASDYTQASTASLFTGRYPLAHGYINSDYELDGDNQTLAEVLAAQGYDTGAFIANGLAGRKYGMDQGFAVHFEKNRALAEELVDQAVAFVELDRAAPFFAYTHFLDVHDPYRTPAAHRERYAPPGGFAQDMLDTLLLEERHAAAWWSAAQGWWDDAEQRSVTEEYFAEYGDLYDAAIRYWDGELRRLLEALDATGQAGRTIVVVVADHGEQLLEHGFIGHANSGYDVGLRIPLIVYDPRVADVGGERVPAEFSLVDLMPTLLGRLAVPVPSSVQGVDRGARAPASAQEGAGDFVYTEGTFFANRPFGTLIQTGRQDGWKLILDRLRDTKELYHVAADPAEALDLFDREPERVRQLWELIRRQYEANREELARLEVVRRDRDEEKLRELVALGYVGGGRARGGRRSEYGPMVPVAPARRGPYGDEPGLRGFADRIDFASGRVVAGQVVRGLSDPAGRRDSRGLWFDRRATFLLRRGEGHTRALVSAYIDTLPGSGHPSRLQLLLDGEPVAAATVADTGPLGLQAELPPSIAVGDYLHLEIRSDHRFVYQRGPSPRTHVYASFRVRSIRLED